MHLSTLLFTILLGIALAGHSKEEWKSRTIYQVLTDRFARSNNDRSPCRNHGDYCGGTYRGLIRDLDYIQEMGFDAIWISPVVDNIDHGYHGYWARDWSKLNDHFGSENDLKDLINECHRRNMWVMVDVVANHVGPVGTDYHTIFPFNRPEHYHDYCEIRDEDFHNNQWRVENCRLCKLPDLKQEEGWIQSYLFDWVKNLVQKYKVDGLRIDTVPEVPKWFWQKYTNAAGVFTLGEVFDNRLDYLRGYIGPVNSLLNYGLFDQIRGVFKGRSFLELVGRIDEMDRVFGNEQDYMGLFVDNHDNPRFLHDYGNWDNLVGALVFSLFYRGIPIVYYGDEQGYGGGLDPENREELWTHMNRQTSIYQVLKKVISLRRSYKVWQYPYRDIWHKSYMLAFTRGPVLVVLTNGNRQIEEDVYNVPFPSGTKMCDVITDYKHCVIVTGGKIHFSIPPNQSRVFVKHQLLLTL
eukprot:TRINITY_DN74_c0_g2_i2.p1 TRINITY_DN74_c0_g2~~TRINITY_DN74_c0_g2_i2.p1  ORF type:complete len:465 (-),score=24.10 TRINITY_DN74_c0_g2_i2:75-1469(-)